MIVDWKLLAHPQRGELLGIAAEEEEAPEIAAVRLEEDGLEALDRPVFLQPRRSTPIVSLKTSLSASALAAAYDLAPADEETGVCHCPTSFSS